MRVNKGVKCVCVCVCVCVCASAVSQEEMRFNIGAKSDTCESEKHSSC
jgi:hypothetical protein